MVSFDSVGDLQAALERLAGRGYARSLGRRPGQKEDRFEQLLGGTPSTDSAVAPSASGAPSPAEAPNGSVSSNADLESRVAALESEVGELQRQVSELLAR